MKDIGHDLPVVVVVVGGGGVAVLQVVVVAAVAVWARAGGPARALL